jgi:hypothetical protein
MEDSKHRCYGCGELLHVKNYNTALPVKGRIGKYISALHVMRKEKQKLALTAYVFIPQVVTRKARKHGSQALVGTG